MKGASFEMFHWYSESGGDLSSPLRFCGLCSDPLMKTLLLATVMVATATRMSICFKGANGKVKLTFNLASETFFSTAYWLILNYKGINIG